MEKEPKKKMTIEGLAVVVNNLAVKVDRGFSDVNEKFKETHKKMDKGFSDVDEKFKEVHKEMDKGFSDVNDKFKETHKKMDKGFSIASKETEDLAIMVGRGFNDVHEKMDKGFADVNSRLDKVDSKLGQTEHRLVMVEDNQLDLKLRMDVLSQNNKWTDELRGRVVVLEKKVSVKGR